MKTILMLSAFALITSLAPTIHAQGSKTTTDDKGNVTKSEPDTTYGDGGTVETTSDKKFRVTKQVYRDKCGRIREQHENPKGNKIGRSTYYDGNGKESVTVEHQPNGEDDYTSSGGDLNAKAGKERVDKYKKMPSAPCPPPVSAKTGPPEKLKEQPNPLGKILEGVSIGVGVGGSHTIAQDHHAHDHHVSERRSTTSTHKTLPAGCKCHPCTCSPCRCGG